MLPAEIIAKRAVECKSYSRALFYWEQHIRQVREKVEASNTSNMLLERLQDIYTQIDEPDGIEGISAHLHVLDIDQQILSHRKAGRWTAAQSWYEIKLAEDPNNVDMQVNLLTCLKESGQHGMRHLQTWYRDVANEIKMFCSTTSRGCRHQQKTCLNFFLSLRRLHGQLGNGSHLISIHLLQQRKMG